MYNLSLLRKCRSQVFIWHFIHIHGRLPVKQNFFTSEELVDLFQREILRLGIEKVDERKEEGVEDYARVSSN